MSKWRKISTAPKNGTPIITCVLGYEPAVGVRWVTYNERSRWSVDPETFMQEEHFEEYFNVVSYDPTHWMPLPAPPNTD
jgi:hypothetical protein